MNTKRLCAGVVLACCWCVSLPAAVLRVPADFATIQGAIDAAQAGDIVQISPGQYLESIDFRGKAITVRSLDPNDPATVAATILSALPGRGSSASAVTFAHGETQSSVLAGLTITGGMGTPLSTAPNSQQSVYVGAGICCISSSPTIVRNIITGNKGPTSMDQGTDAGYGGGIGCLSSRAVLLHNLIQANGASFGGGIFTSGGRVTIVNNVICDNEAAIGGGVALMGGDLINNTLVANRTTQPGSIDGAGNLYAVMNPGQADGQVVNNIICYAASGFGVYLSSNKGGYSWFAHNDVWGNAVGEYKVGGQFTASPIGPADNLSEDPLLVDLAGGDFHLRPESPCIDAGVTDSVPPECVLDLDGEPRVQYRAVDIGADESTLCVRVRANAGPDRIVEVGETVLLDGRASESCNAADTLTFRWRQVQGPAVTLSDPNAAVTGFAATVAGRCEFELRVTSSAGASSADTVVITVGNLPPVADAGPDRAYAIPAQVRLDGRDSMDPESAPLSYHWRQVDGPPVVLTGENTAQPLFPCEREESYAFELTVSDGRATSEPDVVRITGLSLSVQQESLAPGFTTTDYFHYPDISGETVVYGVGYACDFTWNLHIKSLGSGSVLEFAAGGIDAQPKIDGDTVVWFGGPTMNNPWAHEPSNMSIFAMRRMPQGQWGPIVTLRYYSLSRSYSCPVVSGNRAVWLEHLDLDTTPIGSIDAQRWWNTPFNVCGADIHDLNRPLYFTVATNVGTRDPYPCLTYASDFEDPIDLCGDWVVWEANGDIFAADLSGPEPFTVLTLCDHPARQFDPTIWGTFVVWTDQRNDAGDLYGVDLAAPDRKPFAVVRASGIQSQPALDRRTLVYVDGGEVGRIQACALTPAGVLTLPLRGDPRGTAPAIDGSRIVWQTTAYGTVQGIRLDWACPVADGPVVNASSGRSYLSIQQAVTQAQAGDRVVIAPGFYDEDITVDGKALTLQSQEPLDPACVEATVIQGSGYTVTCANVGSNAVVLQGLTFRGADSALFCRDASPLLIGCRIVEQRSHGVVAVGRSAPRLESCMIAGNRGAGLSVTPPALARNEPEFGPTLVQCLIVGNLSYGISGGRFILDHCTVADNRFAGICATSVDMSYSILYFNGPAGSCPAMIGTARACDLQPGVLPKTVTQQSCLEADPLFILRGTWSSESGTDSAWTPGDYHLRADSPCPDWGVAD